MSTAIFQRDGGIEAVTAFMERDLHIAWGSGDPSWGDSFPEVAGTEHGLVNELGRRIVLTPSYCVPDNEGDIVVPSGRFSVSATPTANLYVAATFEYEDSPGTVIREAGLFRRTTPVAGLPPGKRYLLPEQVEDPGRLIALTRFAPFHHSNSNRMTIRLVVSM